MTSLMFKEEHQISLILKSHFKVDFIHSQKGVNERPESNPADLAGARAPRGSSRSAFSVRQTPCSIHESSEGPQRTDLRDTDPLLPAVNANLRRDGT